MISFFRRMSESWIARIFFLIMAVSFVGWGISGDLVRLLSGTPTWIARVGSQTVELPAFQMDFQRALAQEQRKLPSGETIPPDQRQYAGQQTLERLVAQAAVAAEVKDLRIVTPDAAVVAAVHGIAAFKGSDGAFSKPVFDSLLRANGYTEARFLAQIRADLAQQQLMSAVEASVAAPDAEVMPLYTSEFEKRSADTALFALAAVPQPPQPTDAEAQRWYDNRPNLYQTPEYRRIKAVELTPQSLGSEISVTDQEVRDAYDAHRSDYVTQARRSAEVISIGDEAKARALAEQWRGGADWDAMQKAAQAEGGSAISLDDATQVQFPDPDLAKAVFAASRDAAPEPVKGALGWFVVRVSKIVPGGETSFDDVKDTLRSRLLAGKAADLMYDRANKIDQLLGNGSGLDDLPGDLGLAGVAGTLDAQGDTQTGTPAPIPGSAELRSAMIAAAFKTQPGDPPRLTEVPTPSTGGSSYYALVVESITPPGKKPFDEVRQQVAGDWQADQRRRTQDAAAAAMMTAVQDGKSFTEAAASAGVTPALSPLVTRNQTDPSMPAALQRVLFGLKLKEATMVETADGFIVAQLTEIVKPDAAADKTDYARAQSAVSRSLASDVSAVFVDALRRRATVQVDRRNFDSIVQSR